MSQPRHLVKLGPVAAGEQADGLVLHELLSQGLPTNRIWDLARSYGLDAEDLQTILGVSARTLARMKGEGSLQDARADRLYRAEVLLGEAERVLGTWDKAHRWLKSEFGALGGSQPIHLLSTEPGYQGARDVLGRIEHGVWN